MSLVRRILIPQLRSAAVFVVLVGLTSPVLGQKSPARGVNVVEFEGWSGALTFEARAGHPTAVIVPAIGGRVMFYGRAGENILWVNPETAGKSAGGSAADAPLEFGGFHCGLGPEVARLAPQPVLTTGAYEWTARKNQFVSLRSVEEKSAGASFEREIMYDPATGDLGFVQRIKNISDRDAAFSCWHRIACQPGGYVLVPLAKKSRFPAGWSVRRETAGRFSYDGTTPQAEGVRVLDGVLVAQTGSGGAKVGVDSDAQWVAYVLGRTLFLVNFPYYSSAVYSEGGNSVTFSWDARMTELQPMGAEARLRSRRSADLPMRWSLIELPSPVTSVEEARAQVAKIPASPFQ